MSWQLEPQNESFPWLPKDSRGLTQVQKESGEKPVENAENPGKTTSQ